MPPAQPQVLGVEPAAVDQPPPGSGLLFPRLAHLLDVAHLHGLVVMGQMELFGVADAGKGHGSGVLAQVGDPGVDQLQSNRFEVGGVSVGQLGAMGQGGGGDHGICCGDRPGQALTPAH